MTDTVHTTRGRADEGSASVELAILFPLALLLLVTVAQAGLWWHTRTLCLHAAQRGAQAASSLGAGPADAEAAATDFLNRAAGTVADPAVHTTSSGAFVTVRVAATAPRIVPIPGLDVRVTQLARAGEERFTIPVGES